jgi:hypothetical protein
MKLRGFQEKNSRNVRKAEVQNAINARLDRIAPLWLLSTNKIKDYQHNRCFLSLLLGPASFDHLFGSINQTRTLLPSPLEPELQAQFLLVVARTSLGV